MKQESKKQNNKKSAIGIVMLVAASLLLLIGATAISQNQKDDTVLRFGMFAGSYWNVPAGNCYQVIDDAIQRFEDSLADVKVKYVSGILKDVYTEWFVFIFLI